MYQIISIKNQVHAVKVRGRLGLFLIGALLCTSYITCAPINI